MPVINASIVYVGRVYLSILKLPDYYLSSDIILTVDLYFYSLELPKNS
jgi:hypothetical protein